MSSRKLLFSLALACAIGTMQAQTIPLVYTQENTGSHYPLPPLPSFDELPEIRELPDPFAWSDGIADMSSVILQKFIQPVSDIDHSDDLLILIPHKDKLC